MKICTVCGAITYTFSLETDAGVVLDFCSVDCVNIWSRSIMLCNRVDSVQKKNEHSKKISAGLKRHYQTQKGIEHRKKVSESARKQRMQKNDILRSPEIRKKRGEAIKRFWSSDVGKLKREIISKKFSRKIKVWLQTSEGKAHNRNRKRDEKGRFCS